MDMKEQVEKMVERITKDDHLKERFRKEPAKAVEQILGVDLPDELVEKVIDGVKAKITLHSVSDALGSLKKLF